MAKGGQTVNLLAYAYAGSNPASSTISRSGANVKVAADARLLAGCAGVAQLVEHLPSKQDVASSSLVARSSCEF